MPGNIIIETNPDAETVISIHDDDLRVDMVNIGEGLCGDYNPDDPSDVNLLRFDVYTFNPDTDPEYNDGWMEVEDASYCTQIPADAPIEAIKEKAHLIFDAYKEAIPTYDDYLYTSVKKLGEQLSWICIDTEEMEME